ncbi:MAG: glutamate--cysteine ligase [Beijerinckiaceae bacterium]
MARDVTDSTPITSRDELVAWFEQGCKPASAFRLGTEHEKFPYYRSDLAPVPYKGDELGRCGIEVLLQETAKSTGWERIEDEGALIGLFDPVNGGAISLEPGGQFELSGAPLETLHETSAELQAHLDVARKAAANCGMNFMSLGMSPTWTLAETPRMPKNRYKIMTAYMPKVGSRGLDMMYRTCTVQVNLDFASEADMVRKLRVSLALQPLATALFANSPFTEGKPNGLLSARSEIWRDTDADRTGMLPFAFEDGMGFERYVDYALQVPMYFVKRGDIYHDVAGQDFRDLFAGKLASMPGEYATMSDWANHLSTIFPEVRMKRFLEMRGGDSGNAEQIVAFSAFWTGLLYDTTALDAAWDVVKGWNAAQRQALRDAAPAQGLAAEVAGRSLLDIGREVLAISRAGLLNRARKDAAGRDETHLLDPLDMRIARGKSPADEMLELYNGEWNGNISRVFGHCTI